MVCITNSEFTKVSFSPTEDPSIVSDGARMVFTCRHNIWFEFKVADWGHGLVVAERDVFTEVIQRNGCVIIDSDIDLIRE